MTPISTNGKRVTRALGASQSINLTLLSLGRWLCWLCRLLDTAQGKAGDEGDRV